MLCLRLGFLLGRCPGGVTRTIQPRDSKKCDGGCGGERKPPVRGRSAERLRRPRLPTGSMLVLVAGVWCWCFGPWGRGCCLLRVCGMGFVRRRGAEQYRHGVAVVVFGPARSRVPSGRRQPGCGGHGACGGAVYGYHQMPWDAVGVGMRSVLGPEVTAGYTQSGRR